MDPTLIAIAGPLQGSAYPLTDGEITIGRDPANSIAILDQAVSRRHCRIRARDGQFLLEDLDSTHGITVNGAPTRERLLENGDRIEVGRSVFRFADTAPEVEFEDTQLSSTVIPVSVEDTVFVPPESGLTALADAGRTVQELQSLLKVSAAIHSAGGLDALQQRILDVAFEIVAADHGAIILTGGESTEFAQVFGRSLIRDAAGRISISRTAVEKALRERVALACNDIAQDEYLRGAESLIAGGIQAVLVVPMAVNGKVLGAIYLTSASRASPFDSRDIALLTAVAVLAGAPLESARRMAWIESENRRLAIESGVEHDMIGESPRIREIYQSIRKAAPSDSSVLILGETGTGKELAAHAIHRNSPRAGRPFVAVNCAALTETLLESELFGHERGAFTGAIAQKRGKVEEAHSGTLFLDEIGEMSPPLQAKLLRVLQEREFERVGGTRTIKVDFRLVAATNRDLEEAVRERTFRQDLYYRLNVVALRMPALRERREDISLLASYFARKYAEKCNRPIEGIARRARALLEAYDWPGNVRELENCIERAVVMGSGEEILAEDLPEFLLETRAMGNVPFGKYHDAVHELKKQLILAALEQAGGSHTEAAKILGLQVNYLHRLTRNMNLRGSLKSAG